MLPPTMTVSGLNVLIRKATALPTFSPASSISSIERLSSFFAAAMMSSIWMLFCWSYFSLRIVLTPFSIRWHILSSMAIPETSVSRQPFLPHEQMISLSKNGMCPNSPANQLFP